jgi:hypothetical protein
MAQAQDFALDNLPTLHNFQSHRITSADPRLERMTIGAARTRADPDSGRYSRAGLHHPIPRQHHQHESHHLQLPHSARLLGRRKRAKCRGSDRRFLRRRLRSDGEVQLGLFAIDDRRGELTDPAATGAARNCYIPMPFKRSARLTITNLGKNQARTGSKSITGATPKRPRIRDISMRNIAKARRRQWGLTPSSKPPGAVICSAVY